MHGYVSVGTIARYACVGTFPRKTPTIRDYIRKTKTSNFVSTLPRISVWDITVQIVYNTCFLFYFFVVQRIHHVRKERHIQEVHIL
jgi:hypothetical protein